jgi:mono/diheme cytochrome c family protein
VPAATNLAGHPWTNVAPGLLSGGSNAPQNAFSILGAQKKPLAFDSDLKTYEAKRGETNAHFVFNLTNISSAPVVITSASASCGCTIATLPTTPWTIQPGGTGQIPVSVNLHGKSGTLIKQVVLMHTAGVQTVNVKVIIPAPIILSGAERTNNMKLAKADPQAVFKGGCAECHVPEGTHQRTGGDLYILVCGVCHESPRRASMVPNLHVLQKKTDYDYWKDIISNGTTNSLMPAFSVAKGGPLNQAQIDSLADFLNKAISRNFPIRPSGGTDIHVGTTTNALVPGPVTPRPPKIRRHPLMVPTVPTLPTNGTAALKTNVPTVTPATNLPALQ